MNKISIPAVAIVAATLINIFWSWQNLHTNPAATDFPLLAKRLSLDKPDDVLINFAPLRQDVTNYINGIGAKSSFYFEYLFTGTSIRYGDNSELVAASLTKIPLVMDLYKASEIGKINLDQTIVITDQELSSDFGDLYKKGAGSPISLREAARLTLENSDNTAANVIFDHISQVRTSQNIDSLKEIDVDENTTPDKRVKISARAYASILKCLYYACFLNKTDSQNILDRLSQATVDNGLTKALPAGTTTAHKIGTFSDVNESDCGIVYIPKRAYLLCVMIQLPDQVADHHIEVLSKMVYDYVSKQ